MTDAKTPPDGHRSEGGLARLLISTPEFGPLVLLVVMLVVFTFINPAFLSITNIGNALTFTVELGLIALAMTNSKHAQGADALLAAVDRGVEVEVSTDAQSEHAVGVEALLDAGLDVALDDDALA